MNGWLAGGTVGVNAQPGSFVFGVEGEWMWTGIKGNQTAVFDLGGGVTQTLGLETNINWLAIAAARAGFVAADRLMVYGKAGVTLADERHTLTQSTIVPGFSSVFNLEAKALHTEIVAGAGVEYALGGNWSAKFEYDYIKMLAQNFTGTGTQSVERRADRAIGRFRGPVLKDAAGPAPDQIRRELSLQPGAGRSQCPILIRASRNAAVVGFPEQIGQTKGSHSAGLFLSARSRKRGAIATLAGNRRPMPCRTNRRPTRTRRFWALVE